MDTLDRMPFKARKAVFERLEKLASKANMTQEERMQYEEEWKVYNECVAEKADTERLMNETGPLDGTKEATEDFRRDENGLSDMENPNKTGSPDISRKR